MGDSGTSSVLTRWVYVITISSPKRNNHCEGQLIHAIGQSIWNINKDGHADGVQYLLNILQKVINKERQLYWRYINVVLLWIKPCQKYQTIAITFYATVAQERLLSLINYFAYLYAEMTMFILTKHFSSFQLHPESGGGKGMVSTQYYVLVDLYF